VARLTPNHPNFFVHSNIFYETYPRRIEPEGSWPISTHSVHHFLPPATFAISPHIVAISGLTFASRYRGRPYAGRYQFYMNLNNISDLLPSVESCGGCCAVLQRQKSTSCMLAPKLCHLGNHRISKFSSSRHWKLKSYLCTS